MTGQTDGISDSKLKPCCQSVNCKGSNKRRRNVDLEAFYKQQKKIPYMTQKRDDQGALQANKCFPTAGFDLEVRQ